MIYSERSAAPLGAEKPGTLPIIFLVSPLIPVPLKLLVWAARRARHRVPTGLRVAAYLEGNVVDLRQDLREMSWNGA